MSDIQKSPNCKETSRRFAKRLTELAGDLPVDGKSGEDVLTAELAFPAKRCPSNRSHAGVQTAGASSNGRLGCEPRTHSEPLTLRRWNMFGRSGEA